SDNLSDCGSDSWSSLDNITHDINNSMISTNVQSTSVFLLVQGESSEEEKEKDEEYVEEGDSDGDDSSGSDSSGSSSGGSSIPIDNDSGLSEEDLLDEEEDLLDDEDKLVGDEDGLGDDGLFVDEGIDSFYEVDIGILDYISLLPGTNRSVNINIDNRYNEPLNFSLGIEGDELSKFLTISDQNVSIQANSILRIPIKITIPEDESPKLVSGGISFDSEALPKRSIPTILRVASYQDYLFNINMDFDNIVFEREEPIFFLLELENSWVRESNITLRYYLEPIEFTFEEKEEIENIFLKEEVVFFDQELTKNVSLDSTYLLNHKIENISEKENEFMLRYISKRDFISRFISSTEENYLLDEGSYILNVEVIYNNMTTPKSSLIEIKENLFNTFWFKFSFIGIIFVIIGGLLIYFGVKYIKKRKDKRRYTVPEFKNLPGKDNTETIFNVGKIAGTKRKAKLVARDFTTHGLVAGSTGSGKSVSASIIVEEALDKKIPVVVFDPTSQWTGFLNSLKDKNIFEYYPKFNLKKEDARSYKGLIFTPKDANFDLDFDEYMNPGEITVFNLAHLSTRDYDEATSKIIQSLFDKNWEEDPNLKLLCVFDEVHRLLDSSCEGKGYAALTRGAREFRKWGIGLLMASQVSSDFKEAIGGNVLTEVQLNTKNMNDIKKAKKKYGEEYAKRITRQGVGVALVQNPKYNDGKPWFIHFRPPLHNPHKLSEEDLKAYDKYTKELKKLKNKMEELKEKGKDVSNLELDYNLANNKLKEGRFKMTEIYIDELKNSLFEDD
ncbi:MAG: helicase HerA domain-containing protein, partial [Candidatus Woesearchaeota archaeon]